MGPVSEAVIVGGEARRKFDESPPQWRGLLGLGYGQAVENSEGQV